MTAKMIIVLVILLFMIVSFLLRKVPYGVTAMTCCALFVITGITDISKAFAGLSNSTTILIACMLVVAGSISKTSLVKKLQSRMSLMSGKNGVWLLLLMIGFTIVLSQFLGMTAVMTIMLLFVTTLDDTQNLSQSRMIFIVCAICCAWEGRFPVGMGATLPATTNAFYQGMVDPQYLVGMFDLLKVGIIPSVALTIYTILAWKWIPRQDIDITALGDLHSGKKTEEIPRKYEILIYVVFSAVIVGFFFSNQLGTAVNIIPVIGVLVLIFTGAMPPKEVGAVLSSDMVWMVAGVLTVSSVLSSSGVGELIGTFVLNLLGTNPSGLYVVTVFCVVTLVMTTFLSNSGTVAVLTPIAVSTALAGGMNPKAVALIVNLAAWFAVAFPTGCSAATIAFAVGKFNPVKLLKFTVPYLIIAAVTIIFSANLFYPVYG